MTGEPRGAAPLTVFEKIWASHLIRRLDDGRDLIFVDRHVLQETTSAPAFEGLRRAGRAVRHPELTVATQDHIVSTAPGRDRGQQPDRARAAGPDAPQCPCKPHPPFRRGRSAPGHRPCDRAGTRLRAARLRPGLRRQPYLHGRRPRGPRHRRRHQRGRACAGDADPGHGAAAADARAVRGPGRGGRHRQGPDPAGDRASIGIAAGRGCAVEYAGPGDRGAAGRGAADDLQHVDRARRAARPDRAGREDHRLCPRPGVRAAGRSLGSGGRRTGARCAPTTAPSSTARSPSTATRVAPQVTWGTSPQDVVGVDERVPDPAALRRRQAARPRRRGAATIWGWSRARRWTASRSTSPSSAPAPIRGCPTSKPPRRWRGAAGWRPVCGRSSYPGSMAVKRRGRGAGAGPGVPRRRFRVARCRLLDVRQHQRGCGTARRALHRHLQPQFREPPGAAQPHPSGQPRPWSPPPRSAATSSTSGRCGQHETAVHQCRRRHGDDAVGQHQHRCDHPLRLAAHGHRRLWPSGLFGGDRYDDATGGNGRISC